MVDADTPVGPDSSPAAVDLALAVGRESISRLRRLMNEIVDAQAVAQSDRFWPLAVFTMFSRFQRRRRVQALTAEVQVSLAEFDAAVEALRAAGLPLPVREDVQASRMRRQDVQAGAVSGRPDAWAGPRNLVEVALGRVARMVDELQRMGSGQ